MPAAPGEDAPDGIRHNSFVYRFRVDEILKGTFPSEVDIRSGEGGGDCGIDAPIGEPVGLLVDRSQGQLTSYLCAQMEPERLRRAAAPVPGPDGQPPPWLLVGTSYGGGRVLSLDGRGRIVAFGGGQGLTTVIAVCPGSERVAEVSVPPESATTRDPVLAVRDLDTLAIEREVPLPGLGPADGVYREVWRGWESSRALVVGGRLIGLDQGIVRSAPVSGGPVLRFTELGDGLPGALVSVPEASETRLEPGGVLAPTRPSQSNPAESSAVTIAALVAILVAGAVVAVHFSSRRRSETKAT